MGCLRRNGSIQREETVFLAFRPLAMLAKAMGLFPVDDVLRGPYVRRAWLPVLIYPAMMVPKYVFMLVFRSAFLKEIFLNFSNTSMYVRNLRYYNQLLSSCAYFALYQLNFGRICRMVNAIADFDSKMEAGVNRKMRAFNSCLTVVGVAYMCLYMGAYYVALRFYTEKWDYQLYFLTVLYNYLFNLVPTLHIVFFSEAICRRFAVLNEHILGVVDHLPRAFTESRLAFFKESSCGQNLLILGSPFRQEDTVSMASLGEVSEDMPKGLDLADTFSEYCGAFDELSEVVQQVSEALGSTVAVTYMSLVFNLVVSLGFLLLASFREWDLAYSVLICVEGGVSGVLLVLVTVMLGKVSNISGAILPQLYRVKLLTLSRQCQTQFQMLIQRMSSQKVQITAADFFPINRSILTSIVGAVTTYLIILAQFKASEE